jgi:Rrf2 family cysteine metabolism transcriptional repressor
MKLSTRCRYGVRAMIEIARRHGAGAVNRREISGRHGISRAYLENILSALKSAHLISAVRGAEGGFQLLRNPGQVTLYEVVRALEGSIAPVECVDNRSSCKRISQCTARKVWEKLHQAQVKVLESFSLADLVEMEKRSLDIDNYSI